MKPVDVVSEILIERPRKIVAEWSADPENANLWQRHVRSVDRDREGPLKAGTRVSFNSRFLGRRISNIYEILEYAPGEKLVMRTNQLRPTMETTYSWDIVNLKMTLMTVRTRGKLAGFAEITAIFKTRLMKMNQVNQLRRLKQILEAISEEIEFATQKNDRNLWQRLG
ncbi:MAG TPA: SRPBCC family protein [Puia sp.]|nr:SRPBCC family protein [Puia sp.]